MRSSCPPFQIQIPSPAIPPLRYELACAAWRKGEVFDGAPLRSHGFSGFQVDGVVFDLASEYGSIGISLKCVALGHYFNGIGFQVEVETSETRIPSVKALCLAKFEV